MPSAFKAFVSNVQELTDSRVTFRDEANEKCYNALVYDPNIPAALDQASLGMATTTHFISVRLLVMGKKSRMTFSFCFHFVKNH